MSQQGKDGGPARCACGAVLAAVAAQLWDSGMHRCYGPAGHVAADCVGFAVRRPDGSRWLIGRVPGVAAAWGTAAFGVAVYPVELSADYVGELGAAMAGIDGAELVPVYGTCGRCGFTLDEPGRAMPDGRCDDCRAELAAKCPDCPHPVAEHGAAGCRRPDGIGDHGFCHCTTPGPWRPEKGATDGTL